MGKLLPSVRAMSLRGTTKAAKPYLFATLPMPHAATTRCSVIQYSTVPESHIHTMHFDSNAAVKLIFGSTDQVSRREKSCWTSLLSENECACGADKPTFVQFYRPTLGDSGERSQIAKLNRVCDVQRHVLLHRTRGAELSDGQSSGACRDDGIQMRRSLSPKAQFVSNL